MQPKAECLEGLGEMSSSLFRYPTKPTKQTLEAWRQTKPTQPSWFARHGSWVLMGVFLGRRVRANETPSPSTTGYLGKAP